PLKTDLARRGCYRATTNRRPKRVAGVQHQSRASVRHPDDRLGAQHRLLWQSPGNSWGPYPERRDEEQTEAQIGKWPQTEEEYTGGSPRQATPCWGATSWSERVLQT